jgi:hypothetical protein
MLLEKTKLVNRPQTPKAPLITKLKKLVLQNTIDKNTLAGTLTTQKL